MTTLLNATGLTRRFGTGLLAVDGVDFTLDAGDRHAIIGCNGAGKSTLLNLIAGTIRPSAGRITLAGRAINWCGPAKRSRLGIARTFQTPALLDTLTVEQNLFLAAAPHLPGRQKPSARRRELSERANSQLEQFGLADRPGIAAGELSHGQRRLLEIAAALVSRPRLLLLDEPAAGLTDADLERLLDCLRGLPKELAVLLVEHHQDVVTAFADMVTVLHHGKVLTSGTPAQIAVHPEVAKVYLGTQVAT